MTASLLEGGLRRSKGTESTLAEGVLHVGKRMGFSSLSAHGTVILHDQTLL